MSTKAWADSLRFNGLKAVDGGERALAFIGMGFMDGGAGAAMDIMCQSSVIIDPQDMLRNESVRVNNRSLASPLCINSNIDIVTRCLV